MEQREYDAILRWLRHRQMDRMMGVEADVDWILELMADTWAQDDG